MKFLYCILLLSCSIVISKGQGKFDDEIRKILSQPLRNKQNIVLFTGSSTIRLWGDIAADFPHHNVVNAGFGGSQTSDLLYYSDQIFEGFNPSKIFIYEGDNDLSAGKSPDAVLWTTDSLLKKIRNKISPGVTIHFISPKPSIARWNLREKYLIYNKMLFNWTARQKNVKYIDGWTPLLDEQGVVRQDIYLPDGLHLNRKGYDLWKKEIGKYLN